MATDAKSGKAQGPTVLVKSDGSERQYTVEVEMLGHHQGRRDDGTLIDEDGGFPRGAIVTPAMLGITAPEVDRLIDLGSITPLIATR